MFFFNPPNAHDAALQKPEHHKKQMVRFIIQFVDYKYQSILTKLSPDVSCDVSDAESFKSITNFCKHETPPTYEIIGYTMQKGRESCMQLTKMNQHHMKEKFKTGLQVYEFYVNLSRKPLAEPIIPYEKKAAKAYSSVLRKILEQPDAVRT